MDVEYLKEGANWYLRIYIDKPGGVTIDDCRAMSERMSNILDREDPIKQSYILRSRHPAKDRSKGQGLRALQGRVRGRSGFTSR